ncbi:molybdopterin-binding oxidoreductase, partial [Streptomyces sp. SID5998]|nr:molybdopterin-binding oxidoreductase [Streptomyces sp. SID5998]
MAELAAAAVRPQSGPVVAVGGAAIDRTPAAVKDWAIRQFGTDDKLVLRLGILAVLTLLAVALGLLATRYRRAGSAGVLLFGLVGALAATGRPDSPGPTDALPSLTGALAGALLLYALTGPLGPPKAPRGPDPLSRVHGSPRTRDRGSSGNRDRDLAGSRDWDRRAFVLKATTAAAASAAV